MNHACRLLGPGALSLLLSFACGGGGGAKGGGADPAWSAPMLLGHGADVIALTGTNQPGVAWVDSLGSLKAGQLDLASGVVLSQTTLVSNSNNFTLSPVDVATGPGGSQLVAWITYAGAFSVQEYKPASGWDLSPTLLDGNIWGGQAHVAYDTAGNAFAAWQDNHTVDVALSVRVRPVGGSWGATTPLAIVPGPDSAWTLLVAPQGHAALLWVQTYNGSKGLWASTYSPGNPGAWGPAQLLLADTTTLVSNGLRGALDPDGTLSLLFQQTDRSQSSWTSRLYLAQYRASGGWSGPTALATTSTTFGTPCLAVLPGGRIQAAWRGSRTIRGAVFASGQWSADGDLLPLSTVDWDSPRLCADASGNLVMLWGSRILNTSYANVYASRAPAGQAFGAAKTLGTDACSQAAPLALGLDGQGAPVALGWGSYLLNGGVRTDTWLARFR